jgi:hypothetical protein
MTWIGPRVGDDINFGLPTVPTIADLRPDRTSTWYRPPEGWHVADSNIWVHPAQPISRRHNATREVRPNELTPTNFQIARQLEPRPKQPHRSVSHRGQATPSNRPDDRNSCS